MSELRVRPTFGHAASSLEVVRAQLEIPRPVSLNTLATQYVVDTTYSEPLVTGSGVALGGHHNLVVRRDGSYRYWGHFRATGIPSYDVSVVTTLGYTIQLPEGGERAGAQVAFTASGKVYGTNRPGSREYAWDKTGQLAILAAEWQGVREGVVSRNLQYDTDWFGSVGGVASFLAQVVAFGTVFGAAGVAIVCATEAAEILNMEELVLPGMVGIMIAAGAGFVFGPGVMIPVFLAGAAVTAALVKQRHLRDSEKAFLKTVFGDTLPMDRILLTNLLGLNGRAFTTPAPGGAILVNLGEGYDDPVAYNGTGRENTQGWYAPGQLFVHEVAHAWQIGNDTFTPSLFCRAIATAAFGGKSAYHYGPATTPWGEFGTEAQASIVEEWYAGNRYPGSPQSAFPPMHDADLGQPGQNPYYRYIRDNIRAGIT